MPTYDFLNTTNPGPVLNQSSSVYGFTDAGTGVNFTLSINSTDGSNYTQALNGSFQMSAFSGVLDSWTLNLSGAPGPTQFSGTGGSPLAMALKQVAGGWKVTFLGATPLVTTITGPTSLAPGNPTTFNLTGINGQFTGIRFTPQNTLGGHYIRVDSISSTISCFCAGTCIATLDGLRAVETLELGDVIIRADGGETTVKWLGEQPVDTRLTHPAKVNPICITAGALADSVPARDVWVSQDHAIAIDGMLINAGALVNGSTIYQVAKMPLDGFTYYHVETDAHELILAEGCAAETFIDYAGRDSFVNGGERDDAPVIQEMDMPRIPAARLVPEALRARLHERAEAMTGTRRVA